MENFKIELEKIESEFLRIKNLGFVENKRPNNKDGGIGNTFEDLLGVKENNLKDADYLGFEIKSKRMLNESLLSLFTKSPSNPKKANRFLKDNFGKAEESLNKLNVLHASIFGHHESLIYDKFFIKLEIDRENELLKLIVKDKNLILVSDDVHWTFEALKKASNKINKLFVVFAHHKKENEILKFHFTEAEVFLHFNFENFLKFIEEGKVVFDIRIGVYKSGSNIGKPHDHGSGFRIKKENIQGLYQTYKKFI